MKKRIVSRIAELLSSALQNIGSIGRETQLAARQHLEYHLFKRLKRLRNRQRFVTGWLLLAVIVVGSTILNATELRQINRVAVPVAGGTYREGTVGKIDNLNPLFASTSADASVGNLIFSGLLERDPSGRMMPVLAESYQLNQTETEYTVQLRRDVRWQDGRLFSADDVLFTVATIQNAAVRSPLLTAWQGVSVSSNGPNKVVFKLPAPFAPFVDQLRLKILPSHLLEDVAPEQLRTSTFSRAPIGTGPFRLRTISTGQPAKLELTANNTKSSSRQPQIAQLTLELFTDEAELIKAFRRGEVNSVGGLSLRARRQLKKYPGVSLHSMPLNSIVFAFYNTEHSLLDDKKMRTALSQSIIREPILNYSAGLYKPVYGPLLEGQPGIGDSGGARLDTAQAAQTLDELGWRRVSGRTRTKDGNRLQLKLVTLENDDLIFTAKQLKDQWAKLGIDIQLSILSSEEFNQSALASKNYDILLYGVTIGHDPDVYAYWHSSQIQSGLNFSKWKSSSADVNLDVGRARTASSLRAPRYAAFSRLWVDENPALALYQPSYQYFTRGSVRVNLPNRIDGPRERFRGVADWTVLTRMVTQTP